MQTSIKGLSGLTDAEAARRRAAGEGNVAPLPTSRTYWQIIVENVFTFVNVCLFGLGFTLLILRRPTDALIATGVILLNVLVSVVQEIRAKRVLDRIALLTRPTATVIRGTTAREVAPTELVAGDLLLLDPGDQVTADGRLVAGSVSMDESLLTGESDLVEKREGDPLYSGTFCARGSAYYRAEGVGTRSLTYQLTAGARAFRRVLTPLQGEIYRVIRIALLLVLYCEFLLVLRSLLQRVDLVTSVQNSTLVASLVPNGLFLSISVAYALAAVRIVHFGALIQQANAVESLSHVDTICLDKTGTLTANRLVLSATTPFRVSDVELRRLLGVFAASVTSGTRSSEAIAAACPQPAQPVNAEVLFTSERKWSALSFEGSAGMSAPAEQALRGVYVLGAPEMVAPSLENTDQAAYEWSEVLKRAQDSMAQGLRVLLFASTDEATSIDVLDGQPRLPLSLRPLGLVFLHDELRPEAGRTLAAFIDAGVVPKIISGDHPETVAALVHSAGLDATAMVAVSGLDLDQMDDQRFRETANSATIFGRVTPQQKQRLVRAMRQDGHYVAMIGDGVNDVLPLKQADVAIAMRSGSQATRGVADIVLMEDSFAPLVPAVLEGQRILNGMRTILQLFLVRIVSVGAIVFSSLVIGEFPLALRHGSLVTLFSVGLPTVLLAVWAQPGVSPKGSFSGRLFHFVIAPVVLTTVLALLLLYGTLLLDVSRMGALPPDAALSVLTANAAARTTAQSTLAVFLVFVGLFLVIFAEPPSPWWTGGNPLSGDRRPTYLALALMAVFLVLLAVPPLRSLFALAPLDLPHIGLVALSLLAWLFAVRALWRTRFLVRVLGAPSRRLDATHPLDPVPRDDLSLRERNETTRGEHVGPA